MVKNDMSKKADNKYNIFFICYNLDCEIVQNMTLGSNKIKYTKNITKMKRFITIYNGVSQICRKKYLLMHQMQTKQESQLLKMEN